MPIKEWETTKKKKPKLKAKVKRKKKSSLLGVYEPPKGTKKKGKAHIPTGEGFIHAWCRCTAVYKAIERTTKECKCGWSKDHAHCSKCGGTVRVG